MSVLRQYRRHGVYNHRGLGQFMEEDGGVDPIYAMSKAASMGQVMETGGITTPYASAYARRRRYNLGAFMEEPGGALVATGAVVDPWAVPDGPVTSPSQVDPEPGALAALATAIGNMFKGTATAATAAGSAATTAWDTQTTPVTTGYRAPAPKGLSSTTMLMLGAAAIAGVVIWKRRKK